MCVVVGAQVRAGDDGEQPLVVDDAEAAAVLDHAGGAHAAGHGPDGVGDHGVGAEGGGVVRPAAVPGRMAVRTVMTCSRGTSRTNSRT